MSGPQISDLHAPALGAMYVPGGVIESYEEGARQTRVAESPVAGMIMHWAAETEAGTLTGSLWRQRSFAEQFMSEVLADAFTELASPASVQPITDFSYAMLPLVAFASGDDAVLAAGRGLGEAGGAVLVRPIEAPDEQSYREASAALGLVGSAPPGMVSHVAALDDDGVRWIDIWVDEAAPLGFYEQVGLDHAALETVPLHTLVVNRLELEQLPVYPRTH